VAPRQEIQEPVPISWRFPQPRSRHSFRIQSQSRTISPYSTHRVVDAVKIYTWLRCRVRLIGEARAVAPAPSDNVSESGSVHHLDSLGRCGNQFTRCDGAIVRISFFGNSSQAGPPSPGFMAISALSVSSSLLVLAPRSCAASSRINTSGCLLFSQAYPVYQSPTFSSLSRGVFSSVGAAVLRQSSALSIPIPRPLTRSLQLRDNPHIYLAG